MTQEKKDIVFKAIMLRYEGFTGLISQLREDSDVAYCNLEDDINNPQLDMGVIEDIINNSNWI